MIDEKGMKGISSDINSIRKSLKEEKNKVFCICNKLDIQGESGQYLKKDIKFVISDMETLIQKLAEMENGLELILDAYSQCEKRIVSDSIIQLNVNSVFNLDVEGNKDWIDELIEIIEQWKKEREQDRKENEHDKDMAGDIKDLLKSDYYSKSTWKKSSVEEREQILKEFLKDLNDANSYDQIMNTMAHEMRHGYQHSVCDNPEQYENVTEETMEVWRDNFNDYKRTDKDGFKAYRNQPVEKDARKFADRVIK